MANHDKYDTDILKALQRIATSLDKIEKHLNSNLLCLYNYVYGIIDNLNSNNIVEKHSNDVVEKCYNCKFKHFSSDEEPCKSCLTKTCGETSIGHMTNFQKKEE